MSGDLFEFRDYHYEGDLDEYRRWWVEARPVLDRHLDIIDVWLDAGIPARVSGSTPMDLPLGSANVTWVLRWDDLAQRERSWDLLGQDEDWTRMAERHPGWDGYLHMSVRFLEALGASTQRSA